MAIGILFGLLFADFLSHHNYYQAPYAPLWAILSAVLINFLFSFIPKIRLGGLPSKAPRWILILLFISAWFTGTFLGMNVFANPLTLSIDRQFATQFYGLDVAGEYIKAASKSRFALFHRKPVT